ncbi:hypothetical protein BBJ28_00004792 [Nothophytophthora sp. Chile5]|nr:hypothetical protein BBJ28_00004792 [Nothophytophthora sp. Chile5]
MKDGHADDAPVGMWTQRKEALRNMYATSTDQVRVHRRGLGHGAASASSAAAMCQKCLRPGHWTYECKNEATYVQRASRSQQLRNPKLRQPFNQEKPPDPKEDAAVAAQAAKPSKKKAKMKGMAKSETQARRKRRRSVSSSSSESPSSSSSSSGSDSDSSDSSGSSSGSSASSSSGSESESDSESSSSSSNSRDSSRRTHRSKRRRKD